MTTATSLTSLERDALTLAHLSQKLCRTDNLTQEWHQFQDVLARVLSQGDPDESQILHTAISTLSIRQDEEAYVWLLNEVELESERQFLPEPVTKKERVCVLFSIPVTCSVNTALPSGMYAEAAFEEMHDVLAQAKLFDEQASFRLLPRLFTPEELRGRSKSEIRALTCSLGAQVLEDPTSVLYLEDGLFTGTPPLLEDLSVYGHAQLRYLVGVAVIPHEFADKLFAEDVSPGAPAKEAGDGDEDGDSSDENKAEGSGWLRDGSWWAQPFCEKMEDSLRVLGSGFTIGVPQGFHDDMRNGLVLLREQNAMHCLDETIQSLKLDESDLLVEEWPLSTPEGQVVGVAVYLTKASDEDTVYASIVWAKLHHESLEDTVDELHAMLNVMALAPADERLSSDSPAASYLLH